MAKTWFYMWSCSCYFVILFHLALYHGEPFIKKRIQVSLVDHCYFTDCDNPLKLYLTVSSQSHEIFKFTFFFSATNHTRIKNSVYIHPYIYPITWKCKFITWNTLSCVLYTCVIKQPVFHKCTLLITNTFNLENLNT